MCILVVAEPNTIPTREELIMGACSNPHGHGFALITNDGELVVNRSMKADTLIDEFLELREANMNGYAMFHSRYASHGEVSLSNCHPFYLGDDKQTVLAHNGNFCNDLQPKGDDRSDTRWFAEDVMPSLGGITALDNPYLYEMISEWSGTNRVAFLTVNPEAEHELYLIGGELGSIDEDGVWWSNQYHLNKSYAVGASSKFGSAKTLEPWEGSKAQAEWSDSLTAKEWDAMYKAKTQ